MSDETRQSSSDDVLVFAAPGGFGDGHRMGQIQAFNVSLTGILEDNTDYTQFYALETYLFDVVSRRFQQRGWLSTFEFFCIVIWKANRAKTKIAHALQRQCEGDLDVAVYSLTSEIYEARCAERKLYVLLKVWNFSLPMASAILTVMYPDDFTVYDIRVCDELNNFHHLKNKTDFQKVWDGYTQYMEAVKRATPENLSLRDKDRYLWGKSFFEQLRSDVYDGFSSYRKPE